MPKGYTQRPQCDMVDENGEPSCPNDATYIELISDSGGGPFYRVVCPIHSERPPISNSEPSRLMAQWLFTSDLTYAEIPKPSFLDRFRPKEDRQMEFKHEPPVSGVEGGFSPYCQNHEELETNDTKEAAIKAAEEHIASNHLYGIPRMECVVEIYEMTPLLCISRKEP